MRLLALYHRRPDGRHIEVVVEPTTVRVSVHLDGIWQFTDEHPTVPDAIDAARSYVSRIITHDEEVAP